jgi:rare lipoprotein A
MVVVPAPPAPPALELASTGISSSALAIAAQLGERPKPTRISVRTRTMNVLAGHEVLIAGRLLGVRGPAGLPGRMITLQALARRGWRTIAHTRTSTNGRYRLRFTAERTGSEALRLRFAGDGADTASHRRLGELNVYRLAEASWYGGGGSTACGGALTESTLGVANKTLPCGTLVTLRYNGRSIRVPVIDRGPYVAGREFDLTLATKQALGFGDTGEVWSTR